MTFLADLGALFDRHEMAGVATVAFFTAMGGAAIWDWIERRRRR